MTVVSRSQLDHPIAGTIGGAALHTAIELIYSKLGDNSNARYFTEDALADAASQDFDHNFKCSFDELTVILYGHNTGDGELTRLTGATSPALGDFTIEATPGSLTTGVRVTNNSGGAEDIAVIILHSGGGSAGGGGGGGGLAWNDEGLAPALKAQENGQQVYKYEAAAGQTLSVFLKVPSTYTAGKQVKMLLALYSPSSSNTILLRTTAYLIQKGVDAVSSVANSRISTNVAITNTLADQYREIEVDLSDSSGQINGVSVSPSDLIKVNLVRGTDTDLEAIRFIPSATEAKFS